MIRAKPALLKVHRWVAMTVGLLIILQGLTGTMVAFRHELNRALNAGALVVAPPAHLAPMQDIVTAARSAYPDRRVTRIDYPVSRDEAYLVRLESKPGDMAFVAVDPGTASILRKGPLAAWPVEFAYQIHTTLLSGETGERVVGATGLMILFLALTGPFVWWPGLGRMKPALQVDLSRGLYFGARDLHRLAGLLAAPVLLVIAMTGVMMAWQPWLSPVVTLIAPVADLPAPKAAPGPCVTPHTLDQAIAAGVVAGKPGQVIKSVRFPGKGGKVVAVYLRSLDLADARATDHVWVDACTAKVLRQKAAGTEAPGSRFFNSLLSVHTGQWLGLVGRILVLLAAAVAVGLGVTGYVQWVSRTAKMRRNRAARQAKA